MQLFTRRDHDIPWLRLHEGRDLQLRLVACVRILESLLLVAAEIGVIATPIQPSKGGRWPLATVCGLCILLDRLLRCLMHGWHRLWMLSLHHKGGWRVNDGDARCPQSLCQRKDLLSRNIRRTLEPAVDVMRRPHVD